MQEAVMSVKIFLCSSVAIRSAINSKKVTFIRTGFLHSSHLSFFRGHIRFFFVPRNEHPTRRVYLTRQPNLNILRTPIKTAPAAVLGGEDAAESELLLGALSEAHVTDPSLVWDKWNTFVATLYSGFVRSTSKTFVNPVCNTPPARISLKTYRAPPAPIHPNNGSISGRRCPSARNGSHSTRVNRTRSDRSFLFGYTR